MNNIYSQKVEILLRLIPIISKEECFAIHGGTAINLFYKNLPRYSVDIDLTYIPIEDRQNSIDNINLHLLSIMENSKRRFKGLNIVHLPSTCKLLCEYQGKQIKVEVNQTKRGIVGGEINIIPLCEKAQTEFGMYCEARIVPLTLLYGGKIAAALTRQHPRDLFDVKYMNIPIENTKEGFMFCLLGSDKPVYESFAPNLIDQKDAMENQFVGMTDIEFTYEQFEQTRSKLISDVNALLTAEDKKFLINFESGNPNWEQSKYATFQHYPSIQWKLLNLAKLKNQNPQKLHAAIEKLRVILGM